MPSTKEHVRAVKSIVRDTGWRSDAMPPRHGPFEKTRVQRRHWKWRAITLKTGAGTGYRILLEAAPSLAKWKAWLIDGRDPVIIARLEAQPGTQPGLHVHSHCDKPPPTGLEAMREMLRIPEHDEPHRRQQAWTQASFAHVALRLFRVESPEEQENFLE